MGVVLALATAVVITLLLRRDTPQPPELQTQGLDPAVASLIERVVRDVRHAPRSSAAWGTLGSVLMHYEFVTEAGDAFATAERLDPKEPRWPYLHALLLLEREPDAAMPMLRRAVGLAGPRPDMPRIQLTRSLLERGDFEAAEREIALLSRERPDHPVALLELGRLRLAMGRTAEAADLLSQCQDDPHVARAARTLLAQAYQRLGEPTAAERATRQRGSLPADEPWPDPFWQQALAFRVGAKAMLQDASEWMDQGHVEEAFAVLGQLIRDYPGEPEAYYLMGWGWNRAERHLEAEGALREHLRLSPDSAKGLAQLGVSLIGQKRYEDAADTLRNALRLKPTWRELHFNLGYVCQQLERESEAIDHLRQALALDPGHAETYAALAGLLARRGETAEAERLMERARHIRE